MGNNPMVGATVAVAVSVEEAAKAGRFLEKLFIYAGFGTSILCGSPFLFSVNLYNFSKITLQVHTAYT